MPIPEALDPRGVLLARRRAEGHVMDAARAGVGHRQRRLHGHVQLRRRPAGTHGEDMDAVAR